MEPKYKIILYVITTLVYIGFVCKLISIMIVKSHTGWNLFFECLLMAALIGAYYITMFGIKHGTLTPERTSK